MSKGILVVDMPESCLKCLMLNSSDECILQDEDANFKADSWEALRVGCPLVEMPERMDALKASATIEGCLHPVEYAQGFNTCIDKIMGR